jgi:molecular chaperone GrpE
MKAKIDNLQKQIEELTDRLKRAMADYQNLEKRSQKEKEDFARFANKELILKLLPVLDTLEKLETHLNDQGLSLAIKQFKDALLAEGLSRIEVAGLDFDPRQMECVEIVKGDGENKVAQVIRDGYRLNKYGQSLLLRPAQVKVTKKEIIPEDEEKAKEQLTKGDYM